MYPVNYSKFCYYKIEPDDLDSIEPQAVEFLGGALQRIHHARELRNAGALGSSGHRQPRYAARDRYGPHPGREPDSPACPHRAAQERVDGKQRASLARALLWCMAPRDRGKTPPIRCGQGARGARLEDHRHPGDLNGVARPTPVEAGCLAAGGLV